MTKHVLIIQRRMTQYRVPLFDALRRRLAENGVVLQVVYGTPTATEHERKDSGALPWGIKIPCRYLSLGSLQLVWQHIPDQLLAEQDLIIIPHENMLLANYPLLLLHWCRHHAKLAFWGHGANFQSRGKNGFRDRLKTWTARQADWWFAYTTASVQKIVASSFTPQRITCLDNAVDVEALQQWRSAVAPEERQALLTALGLEGERLAVFLGGLYPDKRLAFLWEVADELRRRLPDFELLIVGDGPQRDLAKNFAALRPWCRWVGARHGRDKALHLSLGRVMLNPGLVGLNILDSFAMGLPLLTTDCGIHSPEIAYLRSGLNGVMTADEPTQYADAAQRLLTDERFRQGLAENCRADAGRYTLDNMVEQFCTGILCALALPSSAATPGRRDFLRLSSSSPDQSTPLPPAPAPTAVRLSPLHVVIVWQRFLPYHRARIARVQQRLAALGHRLTAIEVASQDASYGFKQETQQDDFAQICCFPGDSYHDHTPAEIHRQVRQVLSTLLPDVVFAPATAFPEGMAADLHRLESGCRRVMMDDAWEHSDRRGWLTRAVKRFIHRNIDGVFIPAPSHLAYYQELGFSQDRTFYGVDVVDNDYFRRHAESGRAAALAVRGERGLPEKYFLFVGRFLPRKGLETLLSAYAGYRSRAGGAAWELVLVGSGPHLAQIQAQAEPIAGVHFAGVVTGEALCHCYGLAQVLVVPSLLDPWGLVVNEGLAAGLPVLVSTGCGAAATLVVQAENGWTFAPEDAGELAALMARVSGLTGEALRRMGARSQELIADWSLERFADGVLGALNLPRRKPGGALAHLATRLWKGRVSIN